MEKKPSPQLDQETMQAAIENARVNFRNEANYWQRRYEDMRELHFDLIAFYANVTSELRTDIELLEAEAAKGNT